MGKSISAAREGEPYALEPGQTVWIVGNTYELAGREFQYIWDDFERTGLLKAARHTSNDARHGRMFVEFPWKSGVYAKSAENPESLLGAPVHCLILAEGSQLKDEIYQRYLLRAVNRTTGYVINNTTPKGYNWQYETFYLPGQKELNGEPNPKYNPNHWSSLVDVLQNPDYSRGDFEYARSTLPTEIFSEQYLGRFTRYSGLVYKDFRNALGAPGSHVVTPYKLDPRWLRILGYDAGAQHPTAILFGAIKPPKTLVIYDEIHTKGLSIAEYARLIKIKLGDVAPFATYIDPSAKQLAIDLATFGVYACQAENAVLPGIARVTQAIRTGEIEIFSHCEKTIWEFEHYVWDKDSNKPLKEGDDAMDALRYMYSYPFPGYEVSRIDTTLLDLKPEERRYWGAIMKRRDAERERREAVVSGFSPWEYE